MARGNNQKLKMLYLSKIFMEETDENHGLTLPEITERLNSYDVNADRKTLYQDFEELRTFGLDIIADQEGKYHYYKLASREFELAELKLLVDCIQSAKFISERKSSELIRKLEHLVSNYQARHLHRQVYISGRVKTMNESVYYSIDVLHTALNTDRKIRFQYFQWNVKKEMELRKNGAWYEVSPWSLSWDDECYYLIAYDAEDAKIKHYRVDKMLKISILEDRREGRELFTSFDMAKYARQTFGMFGGEEVKVSLECSNQMAGVMIDRFGKDIMMIPAGSDRFRLHVNVNVSGQFLGWIIALGPTVKIIGPESVVEMMQQEVRRLAGEYQVGLV